MSRHTLTTQDFAQLLAHPETGLPPACLEAIARCNWQYDWIEGQALDDLVTGLLERIRRKDFSIAVPGDKTRWVKGWGENLEQFVASKGDVDALAPKYVRPNMPVRLCRRFAQPVEPQFEQNWRRVYQQWLFRTYFDDCDRIYEFGCGSGGHVSVLAQMFPDKKIVGLDWAEPSCEIVNNMHRLRGWNTEGRLFDFYHPDYDIEIARRQRGHDLRRARADFGFIRRLPRFPAGEASKAVRVRRADLRVVRSGQFHRSPGHSRA